MVRVAASLPESVEYRRRAPVASTTVSKRASDRSAGWEPAMTSQSVVMSGDGHGEEAAGRRAGLRGGEGRLGEIEEAGEDSVEWMEVKESGRDTAGLGGTAGEVGQGEASWCEAGKEDTWKAVVR
jgi:hypothetical protein